MDKRLWIVPLTLGVLTACPRGDAPPEDPIDAIDAPTVDVGPAALPPSDPPAGDAQTLPGVRLVAPAIAVPEGVPRPQQYTLQSDVPGPAIRLITVEVTEDPRALVARFNQELEASGLRHDRLEPEAADDGRYVATGHVVTEQGRVRIGVREYRPGEATEPGATAAVNYGVPTGRS